MARMEIFGQPERVITVRRGSIAHLYLRFFMWAWGAGEQDLNKCKVFWGTVFFPIGLMFGGGRGVWFALFVLHVHIAVVSFALGSLELGVIWSSFALICILIYLFEVLKRYMKSRQVDVPLKPRKAYKAPVWLNRTTTVGTTIISPVAEGALKGIEFVLVGIITLIIYAVRVVLFPFRLIGVLLSKGWNRIPSGFLESADDKLTDIAYFIGNSFEGVVDRIMLLKEKHCHKIIIK